MAKLEDELQALRSKVCAKALRALALRNLARDLRAGRISDELAARILEDHAAQLDKGGE
jgi:hypothetical protein